MNLSLHQLSQDSLNRLRDMGFRVLQVADVRTAGLRSPVLDAAQRQLESTAGALSLGRSTLPAEPGSDAIETQAALWARRNVPFVLPSCLAELYKQSHCNGFFFAVAQLRGAMAGSKVGETAIICCCRVLPIQQILPVTVASAHIDQFLSARNLQPRDQPCHDDAFFALSYAVTPSEATGTGDPGTIDLGKGTLCDVLLRYRANSAGSADPDVWGRYEGELFFIAYRLEDYLRLSAIFHWVCGWQLCFAPCGPLPSAVPWMRLLCPVALASALAAPS
jgi:hypothetical protein